MITRRKFFRGVAAAAVAAPVLAVLPSTPRAEHFVGANWGALRHSDLELRSGGMTWVDAPGHVLRRKFKTDLDLWSGEVTQAQLDSDFIAPGHGGYVEVWPGKMMYVSNRTSEPMSREPWVDAVTGI